MRGLFRDHRRGAGRAAKPHRGGPEALGMKNFDYFRPATISDAVAAAAEPGAAYLAAGTNLLDLMKGGVTGPSRLVDVTRLPGLDRIERLPDGGIRIGALVRNADLAHDPDFAKAYPAIAEALHRLPGDTPERESVLEPGDLIVALRLPGEARAFSAHARYLKVRERTSFAFAVVSAAAGLRIEQGTIRDARLALGGVAAKPWRARAAEEMLAGSRPGPDAFRRAAKAALADAKPSGDNQFKIELAQRILVRALTLAAAGTPQRIPALPASPFSSVSGASHDA